MPRRKAPLKRSPMAPRDNLLRRKPAKQSIPKRVRIEVATRSLGFCEARVPGVCTGNGEHLHHVVLRSRGGRHLASNLLHVCNADHRWIHHHPAEATRLGLMAARETS